MKNKLQRQLIMMSRLLFYGITVQCFFITMLLASDIEAQRIESVHKVYLNVELNESSLVELLSIIEDQTSFHFSYRDNDISEYKVSLNNKNNQTVGELLLQISKQTGLYFRQVNNNINVKKPQLNNNDLKKIEVFIDGITISGKVISQDDDSGLPGVNVILKGTQEGTVTDVDGNFTLTVPDEDAILVFSSVGYIQEEVQVGNRTNIDMILTPDITALEEIVVIGYGTQNKKYITGSVAKVDVAEINKQVESNVQNLLQGRVAGLSITPTSGAPGAGMNVNIRGNSSINAGTSPLYVVDGIQIGGGSRSFVGNADQNVTPDVNPLSFLNPNDIESIQVLKDASSTAIYGARGANGVIIITTKKGQYGQKPSINLVSEVGVQYVHNKLDLMNGAQHAQFLNDYLVATGNQPAFNEQEIAAIGAGTDWQDEVTRGGTDAMIQNYQLSASGSNNGLNYFVSGSYFDQDGIVLNTGLTRYSFRSNIDMDVSDKLKFTSAITYARTENRNSPETSASGTTRTAIQKGYVTSPTIDVFDENGDYIIDWTNSTNPENPVWALKDVNSEVVFDNFLGSFGINYNIAENLDFNASLGLDFSNSGGQTYLPARSTYLGGLTQGRGDLTERKNTSWINEYTLTYGRKFGEHDLSVMLGSSVQKIKIYSTRTTAFTFPNDIFRMNAIQTASGGTTAYSGLSEFALVGFLGRINYNYNDRYLITGSVRRDGASVFAPDKKWGTFGSLSAGWSISNESFLENASAIDDLKIRVGYGITGNNSIGPYRSFAAVGPGGQYILGGQVYSGTRPSQLANNELGWENTLMTNFGLDIRLFSNRLYGTFDYFDKTTDDMLLNVTLDASNGIQSNKLFNTGSVTNNGLELLLGGSPVQSEKFDWTIELNATFNFDKNKIKSLGLSTNRTYQGFSPAIVGAEAKIDSTGLPFGSYFGYQVEGVWNNQSDINSAAVAGFDTTGIVPGDLRIKDINQNGFIDAGDRVILGNPYPDFYFGFNNTFTYKGFELTIFVRGVQGIDVINGASAEIFNPAEGSTNKHVDLVDRWTSSNTSSNIPRAGAGGVLSDAPLSTYVEDGSFIKIQNIQLAYTFGNLPKWMQSAKVYLSGQNLATFTDYSGVDPSLVGAGGSMLGIDFGAYPTSSTYMLGVNLGF